MKVVNSVSVFVGMFAIVVCSGAIEAAAQQSPLFGCVKSGTGQLRIPLDGEGCKDGEIELRFNDFPLLVALQNKVADLEKRLVDLEQCPVIIEECSPK